MLGQSRAHGVVHAPAYRACRPGRRRWHEVRGEPARPARGDLPGDWDSFVAIGFGDRAAARGGPGRRGADPVHLRHHGLPEGRRAAPSRDHQQRPVLRARSCGRSAGDVWVNPMPMFHTAGCVLLTLGPVQRLATQVISAGLRSRAGAGPASSPSAGALFGGVPTMMLALLGHPGLRAAADLSSVRMRLAAAPPSRPNLVRRVESALGVPFTITFGQTEASPCITQTAAGRLRCTTAPRRWAARTPCRSQNRRPGDRRAVPRGHGRRDLARGYYVMLGYFDNPEATGEAIDADGLAAHRRPGLGGRARLLPDRGPGQGDDHPRRREHLPARDRARPASPPGGRRTWPWWACRTSTGASRSPPS